METRGRSKTTPEEGVEKNNREQKSFRKNMLVTWLKKNEQNTRRMERKIQKMDQKLEENNKEMKLHI